MITEQSPTSSPQLSRKSSPKLPLPPPCRMTPKISSRTPSPLTLAPAAPLISNSQQTLNVLFAQKNVNSRFESRCSSLAYFNNQPLGKVSITDEVSTQIDDPKYPMFRRLHLNDLADVLAKNECSDFRFVVLNNGGTLEMLFSMGAGRIGRGTALSHSLLACGKEEYSKCVAAGMIYFQKEGDNWCIDKLSNDSGHFKGSVETLITPLILLLEQDTFSFAPQVLFELVISESHSDTVNISLEHLKISYQQCDLNTAIQHKQAIIPTQTEYVSIAEQSITGDNSLNLKDTFVRAPVLDQNDTPLLAPVLHQNDPPVLVTTLSIFNTAYKRNLVDKDEMLEDDINGFLFSSRKKY